MIQVTIQRKVRSIAVAALLLCGGSVFAQQFKSDPVDDKAGGLKLIAEQCVKVPGRYAGDKDRFTEYFNSYFFPAMTRTEPENLGKLSDMRDDLLKGFLWASRDEQLQRDLTNIAFEKTWPIAIAKDYHPAVRYNAMLILGRLDTQYAIDSTTDRRPPIPLEEATKKLIFVVDAAAQGKAVPPFLLVGALIGLERHAQYSEGLGRDTIAAMNAAVLKLASKEVPLPEVDTKVVEWIRVEAATVLARLGSTQPSSEQLAALAKMISGDTVPKMSLDARCRVAALLGFMKLQGASVDGKTTADSVLNLAVSVADDEAKEAKAFQNANLGGVGFSAGYGGPSNSRGKGRMKMNLDTQAFELDNRVILARLGDLKRGLVAAKNIAPADKQPVFDAVVAAIGPAITAAESSDVIDLDKAEAVVTMAEKIRSAVQPAAAAAAANNNLF